MTAAKIIGVLLAFIVAGYGGYDYGYSRAERKWQARELKIQADARDIVAQREADRNRLALVLQGVNDDHAKRVSAMRVRHDAAYDKLRHAYQTGCSIVSEAEATSGNDGRAGNSGLLDSIGKRLKAVAVIADNQAEQLLWCQQWVRQLQ